MELGNSLVLGNGGTGSSALESHDFPCIFSILLALLGIGLPVSVLMRGDVLLSEFCRLRGVEDRWCAGDAGRLRDWALARSSFDKVRPPYADAVTVVDTVGVGGGRGLSLLNSGCMYDSLITTGLLGRVVLFFRNRGGTRDSSVNESRDALDDRRPR